MSSLEERVQALEQEHTELKQKIELHTLAIGGLVNKAALEALNEKNDKIFKALTDHDSFINMQLAELREHVEVQLEGKIAGMQTEMRQRFTELDGKIVGQQTEMRQRFAERDKKIAGLDSKVASLQTEMRQRFAEQGGKIAELGGKVAELDGKFSGLDGKVASLQTTQAEHTTLLHQILARLPEKA